MTQRKKQPRSLVPVLALTLAVAWMAPASAGAGATGLAHAPRVVAEFATDAQFAESMAVDDEGNVFAAVTRWGKERDRGRVWTVSPPNTHKRWFGPWINAGYGLLTGMAFDEAGRLYVAVATFSTAPPPRIVRLDPDGSLELVARLPADAFPNGLAMHDGALYVSDSALGVIWRVRPRAHGATVTRWLQDDALLPGGGGSGIGANGIAFRGHRIYVAVADPGLILRAPVRADGTAGELVIVSRRPAIATADGITFDARGELWIVANANRILRLSPDGSLSRFAIGRRWLNYPTEVVFGPTHEGRTTLYIENGAFNGGTPNIIATTVGVRGLPLP